MNRHQGKETEGVGCSSAGQRSVSGLLSVVILGAASLLAPVGYLLELPRARALGEASGVSPLPLVFDGDGGAEYWATRLEVLAFRTDGTVESRTLRRGTFGRVDGPHRLQLATALPLSAGELFPSGSLDATLHFGFCSNGPLATALDLPQDLREVVVQRPAGSQGRVRWRSSVRCDAER